MMRSYKATDNYKMLQSGWVQTIYHHIIPKSGHVLLKAKVMPSMRVNDPPHNPWIVVNKDGIVLAGHCECKAGLGESCSNVGGLLYKVEMANRLGYTTLTCTDVSCKWNNDFTRKVQPAKLSLCTYQS